MENQTMRQKPKPRGLRNNNPLNIENNPSSKWLGQCGADSRFCRFENIKYGYRAAFRIMLVYRNKYRLVSVRQIISRWAPENENHTEAYINRVCKMMDVKPSFVLHFGSIWADDKFWCCQLVHAMACVENGVFWTRINHSEIEEAYDMAFTDKL